MNGSLLDKFALYFCKAYEVYQAQRHGDSDGVDLNRSMYNFGATSADMMMTCYDLAGGKLHISLEMLGWQANSCQLETNGFSGLSAMQDKLEQALYRAFGSHLNDPVIIALRTAIGCLIVARQEAEAPGDKGSRVVSLGVPVSG